MVSAYMQLLHKHYAETLDERGHKFVRYAVDGSQRMKRLIDDLLAYSRIGTHGQPFTDCPLQEQLSAARRNLALSITESGTQIKVDPLPTGWGDAGQLEYVFQNLLSNAIKFRGKSKPAITISSNQHENFWRITVADNGIGFEHEQAERIFQMFQRLHDRSEYAGSGIGLAITKRIVERHGGRIWAESTADGGSRFCFELPAQKNPELPSMSPKIVTD
jgi:light-regulated signal transduction histidine kinase (bacteriophytochrome)